MASDALNALNLALSEVALLQKINPTPTGKGPKQPDVTRAIGRASVVLLSSHLERYIRNVNEEAVGLVNAASIYGVQLPKPMRLLHSKTSVESLAETTWDKDPRALKLSHFAETEAWLWIPGGSGILDHGRLLTWMSAPKPSYILRYYAYWGIDDIFSKITRSSHKRGHYWLKIGELVDKRNNIAHGDISTEATQADVKMYANVVETFCERSDRQMKRCLGKLLCTSIPW